MKTSIIIIFIFFYSCGKKEAVFFEHPEQLNDGIQTATLKDAGIDEELIKLMQDSIDAGAYPNIHSVLILHKNKLVYEKYWHGLDENRRTNVAGLTVHHRDSLHDVRSITKSITSAAVMIARQQGMIKNLDQRLFDFFPEYSAYAEGKKKDITIRHLLTMTSGLKWHESYNDSLKKQDVSYAMDYILRQPLVELPGSKFSYNSASSQLLAQIVEKATGTDIEKFTVTYLFEPLGINNFEWTKEKNGLISAWAGLRMRSRDMIKFGMLYLNNGKWNDRQIISGKFIDESMRTHIYSEEPYGYGYQFWTLADSVQNQLVKTIEASGNGGQKIEINKPQELVLVITAGNYDVYNLRNSSYDLYLDFVYPAVVNLRLPQTP
jgi:CubicO group peptidase (beta-lactamase class C family)